MKNQEIVIVFATDENYLAPTYVAAFSVMYHSNKKDKYKIFFMVSNDVEEKKIHFFIQLQDLFSNVKISILAVGDEVKNCSLSENDNVNYISNSTYFRFLLPQYLNEYDKCLYLDADIVVQDDISKLWSEDIEGYYFAGVKNINREDLSEAQYNRRCALLQIDSLDEYVNAGVLLLNLSLMRKDFIMNKLFKKAETNIFDYNDQDILNSVCYGKIKLISPKYNALLGYLKDMDIASKLLKTDYKKEVENLVIVHYASPQKPWFSKYYAYADRWIEMTKRIPEQTYTNLVEPFIRTQQAKMSLWNKIKAYLKQFRIYRRITMFIKGQ